MLRKTKFLKREFLFLVILFIFIFFIAESCLRILDFLEVSGAPKEHWSLRTLSSSEEISDFSDLRKPNRLLNPKLSLQLALRGGSTLFYDIEITSDKYGRRKTVPSNEKSSSKHVMFFGCSQTFGRSVSDKETIPSYLARLDPKTEYVNYGVSAGTISNALHIINTENLAEQVANESGTAVYLFYDYHVFRLVRPKIHALNSNLSQPIYRFDSNKWNFIGYFFQVFPFSDFFIRRILRNSKLLETLGFAIYKIYWLSTIDEPELNFAADLMLETKSAYEKKFKGNKFLVVILSDRFNFATKLMGRGISYIDLTDTDRLAPTFKPADGHYRAEGNEMIARELLDSLSSLR